MANNKVVFGQEVLIDLTQDTVTPYALEEGYTAHAPSGEKIVGVMKPNKPVEVETNAEMTAISTGATEKDLGKVYLFVGEDDGVFEKDALYILVKKGTGYGFQRYAIGGSGEAGEDLTAVLDEQSQLIAELKEKLANGGGSGGGSQECDCIIDVTELPTENIDENAIYRLTSSGSAEMYFGGEQDGTVMYYTVAEFWAMTNIPYIPTYTVVDTIPSSWNCINQETMVAEVYIDKATGIGYLSDGTTSMPLSAVTSGAADCGWIDSLENMTTIGYYAIGGGGSKLYQFYNGEFMPLGIEFPAVKYSASEDGTYYTASGYSGSKNSSAAISSTYNNLPVKGISSYGFSTLPIKQVTIAEGVETIGASAFQECISLEEVGTLPSTIKSIGELAFYESGLRDISIPANTITSIESQTFSGCYRLDYVSLNEGITSIGNNAFYYCISINSMTLPEGVTDIGQAAFAYCKTMESINLPSTLATIGDGVFHWCLCLKAIYYRGTKAQWKAITFGTDWDVGTPDYTITCTDGTIAKDGTET